MKPVETAGPDSIFWLVKMPGNKKEVAERLPLRCVTEPQSRSLLPPEEFPAHQPKAGSERGWRPANRCWILCAQFETVAWH
jgi:hypothetical protein